MKTNYSKFSDELIGMTQTVWRPRAQRDLTYSEAENIAANVAGLFSLLAEWSNKEAAMEGGCATNDIREASNDR